jgi:hypothetical protein
LKGSSLWSWQASINFMTLETFPELMLQTAFAHYRRQWFVTILYSHFMKC